MTDLLFPPGVLRAEHDWLVSGNATHRAEALCLPHWKATALERELRIAFRAGWAAATTSQPKPWSDLFHKRLLVTHNGSRPSVHEWMLLELSPSGKLGKFQIVQGGATFWTALETLELLDILPPLPRHSERQTSRTGYPA